MGQSVMRQLPGQSRAEQQRLKPRRQLSGAGSFTPQCIQAHNRYFHLTLNFLIFQRRHRL